MLSEQSVKVSGVVVDEQGVSLPGVNVVVKGSSHGTITDFDGMFNLEVMPESILTFSYIGYNTKEIKIQKAQSLKVTLKENTKDLEEVIVVGYGTQRKSDLTGSVVSVKADDVNAVPTSNIAEMLRGQAAGLQVTTGSSRPGGSSSITIRGNRSLTGGNSPLFVVDGVPVNNIDDLNAADIKSIEVLKDASAQSIYGARAANGVILV
ncbi:MAG: TonB-dependent receptor plug domain-containing protein, partial [Bacteroidales bacterium]